YMFILSPPHSPISAHFPYTTLFRSQVRMRIHKRVPDARLGSQVNHELKALFCKEVIKPFAVGKVDRFKIEVRLLLEQIQPCPLQVWIVVVVKVVDTRNQVVEAAQFSAKMEADEPCCTCN